ncbi:hypothetical protein [Subtercola boreus]|uniref:Uncharacterized protein n=1 Tax=Subtercola boreus TaxID=120213 RepID=A0A3E0WFM9_9MICO|nr:hypothetical protein [Subtercola boreus]RFA22647.1 hypothetical protein B7R24_03270 [Subtercola boreus]RFA23003.1 hypothetical protein B7R23_03265 [Subtercola boreus]RFA28754.1 hypothetical protein B7R25_03280 [Subtercola boreus]
MPEDPAESFPTDLTNRIGALEAERLRLQKELDQIANRALDRWLSVEVYESHAVESMQQTLSWKVTKPLRAVREAQLNRPGSSGRRGSTP